MKLNLVKLLLMLLFISPAMYMVAQKKETTATSKNSLPASFNISKAEIDLLLSKKVNESLKTKRNKYLDKSTVLVSVINGDIKYMKLKLKYFTNAALTVQVNGIYSTQLFILSDSKKFFYKGTPEKDGFLMTTCDADEIVTE